MLVGGGREEEEDNGEMEKGELPQGDYKSCAVQLSLEVV